jgi:lipopolysaccharide export system ATP-binding protein
MIEEGLVVSAIAKKYSDKQVLNNISLVLNKGESVALLGPNGSGKTTCFYIISGLIKADSGAVFIDGKNITNLPMSIRANMGIGYLPQDTSVFRGLSVEENIMAVLEVSESNSEQRSKTLYNLMEEFSISHLRNINSMDLSGGEKRRLEIARALASNPKYILFDEPLAGIDPIAIAEIRTLITNLKKKGIGILITDHNVYQTLRIIDRAYIINNGIMIAHGKPSDIINNEEVRKNYLGEDFEG